MIPNSFRSNHEKTANLAFLIGQRLTEYHSESFLKSNDLLRLIPFIIISVSIAFDSFFLPRNISLTV